jgi:CrcB protein
MSSVVYVALGGACGALARYGTGRLVARLVEPPFPWGTWAVNLIGCFLIGVTVPLLGQLSGAERARFFLVVGFLGSFTTFSTFSLGLLNAAGSLVCGLVLVAVGREVSAWLLGL